MTQVDGASLEENTPLLHENEDFETTKPDQLSSISPLAVGNQRLLRQIDWPTASLINVSYMIGGGIFASPALTLSLVGSGGMNIVIWIFASMIALTGVATYAELGTMWRGKGVFCLYLSKTQAFAIIHLCILRNHSHCFCGFFQSEVSFSQNISFNGTSTSVAPYASALYYCMHGYSGFNAIQYSLDEDPIKNLPKIAQSALGLTATLYVLAIASYMTVLSVEDIKSSELTVAASFFSKVFGGGFASTVLPILVGLSAVGCATSLTFSGGRLILETARDGLLPYSHTVGYVNPKYKSPINALLLQYIIVIIYLIGTPGAVYQFIIAFASWPAYIFFLLIGIGVLILRQREPALTRPYKAYSIPYATSIGAMMASAILWYNQVIVLDSPSKSYNQQILEQGRDELAREVYA
ncbi:amino acid permease-domain-containing protein [Umbelopsis sp. PMI_123]|nr:amino acid permease-domain-containing protein [Umbelopsis sp. PMI_123]